MTAVERRRSERNGSAVIRALGRTPSADYRAQQLRVNDVGVGIATPYLLADPSQDDAPDDVVSRGVVDAIAVGSDILMVISLPNTSPKTWSPGSSSTCSNSSGANRSSPTP